MLRARGRIRVAVALCCGAIALALLVIGTVPVTPFLMLPTPEAWPLGFGVMGCRLVVSWESGQQPGAWAGQTNDFGFRYDRYSNGISHLWVPLWLFALPFAALALFITARTRRRFPVIRTALLALPPIVLALLWMRSYTPRADFHVYYGWFFDFQGGDVLVQRVQSTTYGRYTSSTMVTPARFPLWPLVFLSLLPVALYAWRHRRGLAHDGAMPCLSCGYDMRATPERCPECGTAALVE